MKKKSERGSHEVSKDKDGNPMEDYLKELEKYEEGAENKKMEIEECSVKHDRGEHKSKKKTYTLNK